MSKILGRILLVGAGAAGAVGVTVMAMGWGTWPFARYIYLQSCGMTEEENKLFATTVTWDGAPGVLKDTTRKYTYPNNGERWVAYLRLYSRDKVEGKKYIPPGEHLRRANVNAQGDLEFSTGVKKAEDVWDTFPDMLTIHGFPQPIGFTCKAERKTEDYCSVEAVFKF